MGHVDLPGAPQDVGASNDESAFTHLLSIDECGRVARDENKYFGRVAEPVIADRDPGHDVRGDVIQEDQPKRDAAKQIEPQIAGGRCRSPNRGSNLAWRFAIT